MKANINNLLNKLIAFAEDNLMLDSLDAVYALNKLATLVGVKPELEEADYGDATYTELLDELCAAAPVDKAAVTDILLPLPHTVNYYFNDQFSRNPQKAFEFIFDLYAQVGGVASSVSGSDKGYTHYEAGGDGKHFVALPVGGDHLKYTPLSLGACVGTLECKDFMSEDIASRMAAFADAYKMTIAKAAGDGDYYTCGVNTALSAAPVKAQLSDGAVKIALLDYAVPALSVSGPKNSTIREAAKLIKTAADKGLPCVVACEVGQWTKFYLVFAKPTAATDVFAASTPLSACGVFGTVKMDALLSVLEKGTALSTDLFRFKAIYDSIGGVKHGAKAGAALAAELAKAYKAILSAAATCDEAAVKALAEVKADA
ncbi:MAG: hypothetical protein J1F39_01480 [Clostridiales bacterium]|nr:hypothetical protein [Clostridiales bacterium]